MRVSSEAVVLLKKTSIDTFYLKKMYVELAQPNCDKFKPSLRGPLDKYS